MATKTYAKIAPLFAKGVQTYQWSGMATGDDGLPALDVMRHTKKTLQAEGTVTSVPIQGRIDGGAWVTLVTLTAAGIIDIPQDVDDIRPVVTTGAAVIITLQVVAPSRALSGTTSLGGLVPLPGGGFSFPTGQILAPDGTVSAPAYSFASATGTGWYVTTTALIGTRSNTARLAIRATGLSIQPGDAYQWASTSTIDGTTDLILARDTASTLAQRNSTNAQTFRVYNTFTDASNGEWLEANWSLANPHFYFRTMANGSGTLREFRIGHGGTNAIALRVLPTIDGGISLGSFNAQTAAVTAGRVVVGQASSVTATAGSTITLQIGEQILPTATSTLVSVPVKIAPTINYSNATPGAGWYEALKIAIIETALPTGQSYMIRASGGAAGTTDRFGVLSDGRVLLNVPPAPGTTPPAGYGWLYQKADKKLYFKDDAGLETALF